MMMMMMMMIVLEIERERHTHRERLDVCDAMRVLQEFILFGSLHVFLHLFARRFLFDLDADNVFVGIASLPNQPMLLLHVRVHDGALCS